MSQHAVRGARGGGLTILGSSAAILIQVVSVTVLSRLLRPEDFGLVAMVGVFVALGNLLKDFGLPLAALQAKDLSSQQASNLFWLNVALAAVTALALAISTPLLVAFYSEPRLTTIVPALAAVILLGGVGSQLQVGLAREMRYSVLVGSDLGSQLLGLAAAIAAALSGWGYWALVAQVVSSDRCNVILCLEVCVVHSSHPEGPWPTSEVVGQAAVHGVARPGRAVAACCH